MAAVRALIARLVQTLKPPEKIGLTKWARTHRRLSAKASALPGVYNPDLTPWVFGIHDAIDDPTVRKVVAMKSELVPEIQTVV